MRPGQRFVSESAVKGGRREGWMRKGRRWEEDGQRRRRGEEGLFFWGGGLGAAGSQRQNRWALWPLRLAPLMGFCAWRGGTGGGGDPREKPRERGRRPSGKTSGTGGWEGAGITKSPSEAVTFGGLVMRVNEGAGPLIHQASRSLENSSVVTLLCWRLRRPLRARVSLRLMTWSTRLLTWSRFLSISWA